MVAAGCGHHGEHQCACRPAGTVTQGAEVWTLKAWCGATRAKDSVVDCIRLAKKEAIHHPLFDYGRCDLREVGKSVFMQAKLIKQNPVSAPSIFYQIVIGDDLDTAIAFCQVEEIAFIVRRSMIAPINLPVEGWF